MAATRETINVVTLNMGGSINNPFEYYPNNKNIFNIPLEWDYRKTLRGLTISMLKSYLGELEEKYSKFRDYLYKFDNIDLLDYFFQEFNMENAETILELENKFGRKDSKIKRFNPIEFGYDPVYFIKDKRNQYNYTREYASKNIPLRELLKKCLEVPFLNNSFSLVHTKWLSKTYDIERVYDIILYDMMKTYSVYINYKLFDEIYISNTEDKRLDNLLNTLNNEPSILITQEGGFNDNRVNLLYETATEGGVKVYSYNIDATYRINSIPYEISKMLGNKKTVDIEIIIDNRILRVVGVHCKEPKGDRTYDKFVRDGIMKLFEPSTNGILSYFRNWYDWYYNIKKRTDIIIGDFNPKNNDKVIEMREMFLKENIKMYPLREQNTTMKMRSGYCAQHKKFWKTSTVCKDMAIVNTDCIIGYKLYPSIDKLLTEEWRGDHCSFITTVLI